MTKELSNIQDLKNAFISHCKELGCDKNYIKACENKFNNIATALKRLEKIDNRKIVGTTTIDKALEQFLIQQCPDVAAKLKKLDKIEKVFEKLNLDISDDVDLENWIKLAQFHYENKNKKIKAFKIINEKEVNVQNFKNACSTMSYEQYLFMWKEGCFMGIMMTSKTMLNQEEYELLKEVLLCQQ